MNRMALEIDDWLGSGDVPEDATFGAFRLAAEGIILTEVNDTIAKTTRPYIRIPASIVAEWLLTHWWRLRWEPRPEAPTQAWRRAHCMGALGGGVPWPPLEISSDGEVVQLSVRAELNSDVAAIRYLNSATVGVPAAEFERAVDQFV